MYGSRWSPICLAAVQALLDLGDFLAIGRAAHAAKVLAELLHGQVLGQWVTERRNVAEDFKKIYGEAPDDPAALSIAVDSNDTQSVAESFMGPIVFRRP